MAPDAEAVSKGEENVMIIGWSAATPEVLAPAERFRSVSPAFADISCKIPGTGTGSFFLQDEKNTARVNGKIMQVLKLNFIITLKDKKSPRFPETFEEDYYWILIIYPSYT
jgi:hypothetical protein